MKDVREKYGVKIEILGEDGSDFLVKILKSPAKERIGKETRLAKWIADTYTKVEQ